MILFMNISVMLSNIVESFLKEDSVIAVLAIVTCKFLND